MSIDIMGELCYSGDIMTITENNKTDYKRTTYYIARDYARRAAAWIDYQFTRPL